MALEITKEKLADFYRQAVVAITLLLIFAVSVYAALEVSNDPRAALPLACFLVAIYLVICALVHEMGHATAAWLAGWRVHLIVVGSLAYAPRSKRFVRVMDHRHRQDVGGWVHATPPHDSQWRRGMIPFMLGGPLGNLMFSVLSMLTALAVQGLDIRLESALLGLGGVSFIIAVSNLVPISTPGGWKSDGASLIDVLNGEGPTLRDQKIGWLLGMVYDDVPAEEWDVSALIDLMDGPARDREHVDPLLIVYAFHMADLATAKNILERYLKAFPFSDFEFQCMYAFTVTMVDRDAFHASNILGKLPRKLVKKSFSFWRAQATTAHLLGRRVEALEAIRNAREVANKMGMTPDGDDETIFQAIEQGQDLPRLEPRGRLSARKLALREASA